MGRRDGRRGNRSPGGLPLLTATSLLAMPSVAEWFDPSTNVVLSGSKVSTWTGRKLGAVASQGTDAQRPTFSADAGNGQPGLAYVSASAQHLVLDAAFAGILSNVKAYTLFINFRLTALVGSTFPTLLSTADAVGGSDARIGYHVQGTGGELITFRVLGAAQSAVTAGAAVAAATRYTYAARWGGSGPVTYWKNGTAYVSAVSHTVDIGTQIIGAIGATVSEGAVVGNYLDAVVGDVVIASSAMSDADVAQVQTFLASRRP